ncbi:MAG: type IV toxin-antitoxin system AbiEi family antitoxin domain-containing protein [Clostridia bacterium]|nr:type IV toxin-antitoxin system AbiEi family antitoxin domain-containing protein [Clostridia bacterium]
MATRFDLLDDLVEQGDGYLRTADVVARGVSKPTLAEYVQARNMERVAHGIYLSEEAWPDELFLLSAANSRIVFSHETALHLHGLMEREPAGISVSVMTGYNASHLRQKGIRVYQVKTDVYSLGITQAQTTWGHAVPVYDRDRTICDLVLHKQSTDIQIFQYAMKEYMTSSDKNLNHLMMYAEKLHIADTMRMYTEVML